jgi:hypothetical protein
LISVIVLQARRYARGVRLLVLDAGRDIPEDSLPKLAAKSALSVERIP